MIQPFQKKFAYSWVRKGKWTADAIITKALPSQSYRALRSWLTAELSWISARGGDSQHQSVLGKEHPGQGDGNMHYASVPELLPGEFMTT